MRNQTRKDGSVEPIPPDNDRTSLPCPQMSTLADLENLPGADLVQRGVADLGAGRESAEALLVSIGAPRLRLSGMWVEPSM